MAATAKVMPSAIAGLLPAASTAALAPPPRLMFATAGSIRLSLTQSMPGDYARPRSKAVTAKHTHGVQRHGFGDAVGTASNRAGYMCAMPTAGTAVNAVHAVTKSVKIQCGASAKFIVREKDAGVDYIDMHPRARGAWVVVIAVQWQGGLVNAVQPPGWTDLNALCTWAVIVTDGYNLVGFDIVNTRVLLQGPQHLRGEPRRETFDRGSVYELDLSAHGCHFVRSRVDRLCLANVILIDDDVLAGDYII